MTFRCFRLDADEMAALAEALETTQTEFLIAYDPMDDCIKYRVDGGIWSPPAFGEKR